MIGKMPAAVVEIWRLVVAALRSVHAREANALWGERATAATSSARPPSGRGYRALDRRAAAGDAVLTNSLGIKAGLRIFSAMMNGE